MDEILSKSPEFTESDDDPDGKPAKYWETPPPGYHWVEDPGGSDASAGYWKKDEPEEYNGPPMQLW